MGDFLKELKRRNVFRVGVAYVIVSWLIVQVIETVSDPLGLPEWTEAFFIVLVLAGLPLVLIFAWAFELTPEGLKKTKEVDKVESVTAHTGKKLNYAIIGVLVLALVYSFWERQGMVERVETAAVTEAGVQEVVKTSAASIAVLPFVNMSADPEQEYFSDGISEELLNLLAKIPELRVPARTSSFQFKGQNLDIADVAEQLNVAHVLEGSVRRADVRIRVTAQLIEAETGYHLWSETYDRELTDIFAIQDEISAAIVAALSDTLGIKADAAPHVKAAANPQAYNAFLLGQHLIQKRTKADIEAAIPNYEQAIELDPEYAPAHAGLGLAWYLLTSSRPTYGDMTLQDSLSRALPHLEKALVLDPGLPEALGAMGLTFDARERYEEALPYYEKALSINPSQTDIRNWYSSALDEVGREVESQEEMRKAYEIDPLSVLTLNNYAVDLIRRRDFDSADPVIDRLYQIDPGRGAMFRSDVHNDQQRAADGAIELFRGMDVDSESLRVRGSAAFMLLNFGLEQDALQIWPFPDILPIINNTDDEAYALELAQQLFEEDPTDPSNIEVLAWNYWTVGDKERALRNARRYADTLDPSRRRIDGINRMFAMDAWQRGDTEEMLSYLLPLEADWKAAHAAGIDGLFMQMGLGVAAHMQGNTEEAYDRVRRGLTMGTMTPINLRRTFEAMGWDDLPRFEELRDEHEIYIAAEKIKFLKVACGPDGFVSWQPSPETCAEVEAI